MFKRLRTAIAGNPHGSAPYGIMVIEQPIPQPAREAAPDVAGQLRQLQHSMANLERTIRLMEEQRQHLVDRRRRRLAIVGGSISVLFHICLLVWLALVYRGGGGGGDGEAGAATVDMAILNQEELSGLEQTSFDQLQSDAITFDQPSVETTALTAVAPNATAQLSASSAAVPSLGGTGAGGVAGDGSGSGGGPGGGMGLGGGGGGGTSFFGISGKGTRFAYIVDISASMADNRKLEIAKRELVRSIDALPDYSSFYVLLFSTDFLQPPMQKGWMRARKPIVRQFTQWLNQVDPNGGTAPRSSFMQVFSLETRPDVLFFLTDGLFEDISAEEISELNKRGHKIVINTIQFGDRNGQDLLRNIAKVSGGVYRFVPAGGG